MPVVSDYTALLGGDSWNGIEVSGKPVLVTYSFPTAAPSYDAGVGGFTAATVSSFQTFTSGEQAQVAQALGEWSAASGLTFIQVAPGKGDINFQNVDFNTTSSPSYAGDGGIAFYPFGDWNFFTFPSFQSDLDASGDVFMNSRFLSGGTINYGTLLHEIGHAIGLKHPTEVVTDYATNPATVHDQVLSSDDPTRTVMAEVGDSSNGTDTHLLQLDKDAAAYLYGAAGTGGVVTGSATGANAVLSSWSWDATNQVLTETGFAGDDTIRGTSVNDVINGLDGNNRLFGLNGDDSLTAGTGNDVLDGGPGADTMVGGAGDDTYIVDSALDVVTEAAGGGNDTEIASLSVTLAANVETLQVLGSGLTATGNGLANTIYGDGTFATVLRGMAGADYIVGGAGNDTIDGGTEADQMYGQLGDDTYVVDNAGDVVGELANQGTDTVQTTLSSYTLGDNVENLVYTGAASFTGTGNALANMLTGGAGNDKLSGGAGADTLVGGAGNDTFVVDNVGDMVTELAGQGTDTEQAQVTTTLAANVENLTLTTSAALNGTGNALDNKLVGNAGANVLDGGAGADTLTGGAGNDTFVFDAALGSSNVDHITDFTAGSDLIQLAGSVFTGLPSGPLSANAFKDLSQGAVDADDRILYDGSTGTLSFDADGSGTGSSAVAFAVLDSKPALTAAAFTVTGGSGVNVVPGATEGADTLTGTAGADLIDGLGGNDTLTGGDGPDTLYGRAGDDRLDGGTEADLMYGGAGNDTYLVDNAGDVVREDTTAGTDDGGIDLVMSSVSFTLGSFVENLTLTGTDTIGGTGNDLANLLIGNGAANSLSGQNGNDTLNGGAGADTLVGGMGDDLYVVDNAGDVVTELANQGIDTVQTALSSYTLGDNVENLVYTGAAGFSGTGNALANMLTGGSGNDKLSGGTGADTLVGGAGNDTYVVDNVGDVVTELAGQGTDTEQAQVTTTLAANVENLTLTTSAALNGTGNALANKLVGNGGANVLDGGAGADTLTGGAGNDTFVFHLGQANGDSVTDFTGAGPAVGDVLNLFGYGTGATLAQVGTSDSYAIHADAAHGSVTETLQIVGVTNLDTATGTGHNDVVFG